MTMMKNMEDILVVENPEPVPAAAAIAAAAGN